MSVHPDCHELFHTWIRARPHAEYTFKNQLDKLNGQHISGIHFSQLNTPLMLQHQKSKEQAPNALLFFRMGDFFECFGLDALILSDVCQLTLTARDKHSPSPVPMAGLPVISLKSCVKKCVDNGLSVAICDQMPTIDTQRNILDREIVRIVTPSLPWEDDQPLDIEPEGKNLVCFIKHKNQFTFAYLDITTGLFRITVLSDIHQLEEQILKTRPKECLVNDKNEWCEWFTSFLAPPPRLIPIRPWILKNPNHCQNLFCHHFTRSDIHAFGLSHLAKGMETVCGLLNYLEESRIQHTKHFTRIEYYQQSNFLFLDDATKKNLHIFSSSTGEKTGSLFFLLNQCTSPTGTRQLIQRMQHPLNTKEHIEKELDDVHAWIQHPSQRQNCRKIIKQSQDIERILASASQRDFTINHAANLQYTLQCLPLLGQETKHIADPRIQKWQRDCECHWQAVSELHKFLESSVDIHERRLKPGLCPSLDQCILLTEDLESHLHALEKKERELTGIASLRVGFSRTIGYFFEVPKSKTKHNIPAHLTSIQRLTNTERFSSAELNTLQKKIAAEQENRIAMEKKWLEMIRQRIIEDMSVLQRLSQWIGKWDLTLTFASLAHTHQWVKPQIACQPVTHLIQSTHPLMQNNTGNQPFVPNSIELGSPTYIHVITGPNMAGKSTLMRQVALAQYMTQLGCYVAAKEATVGVCDKILTRIGSADHPLKKQSTFMVEMIETAQLLKLATQDSLLILDEVGRGTSTGDGFSLAWALLEYIHDFVQARTLFSTHYHTLGIKVQRPGIVPMYLEIFEEEENKNIVFSHIYKKGVCTNSYGLHIARWAALPEKVIQRAADLLNHFPQTQDHTARTSAM